LYIEYFESLVGQKGYNICLFGLDNTGRKVSNETKYKISIAHIGKKLSQEHRRKISLGGLGRRASEETKMKISISHLGAKNPNKKWKAYGNPNFNKNIYHFRNRITNETFTGYQYDFYTKYNLRSLNVNEVISGKDKSYKNWILVAKINLLT
jgi:hypothetical protein